MTSKAPPGVVLVLLLLLAAAATSPTALLSAVPAATAFVPSTITSARPLAAVAAAGASSSSARGTTTTKTTATFGAVPVPRSFYRRRAAPPSSCAAAANADESDSDADGAAAVAPGAAAAAGSRSVVSEAVLSSISESVSSAESWGDMFDLRGPESTLFAVFSGIRHGAEPSGAMGCGGIPFLLRSNQVVEATAGGASLETEEKLAGFFTYDDLIQAVEEDFLDADRGSTDSSKGWKVAAVSKPRGDTFEDARMTREEIDAALRKGTVILSSAGAHIPKLAGAALACTDASSLPSGLNLYATTAGKVTSAPPHTDRQDVVVVQTQGKKRWRVYSPPDPTLSIGADMFARGKGNDDLPLDALNAGEYGGTELLLDATLEPGDVLFVPSAFPHTTDTIVGSAEESGAGADAAATSVHLTFNFDTHVWDLDYLSARRLALRRAGVTDWALGQFGEGENRYVGRANAVQPPEVRIDLFRPLPLGLLDDDDIEEAGAAAPAAAAAAESAASELERISRAVDEETASEVPSEIWAETIEALRRHGLDLMDIHRDMYISAVEEGRTRRNEEAMTAHLRGEALMRARAMTPEKMQRLSVFRVREYFGKINEAKEALVEWSRAGVASSSTSGGGEGREADGGEGGKGGGESALPDNWEFTLPLDVGDQVEADLGGAFFEATVTKAEDERYDVQFFDGDSMEGLSRDMIKLLTPPT